MPDWLSVIWRGLLSLLVLFLMTKWLGKKQISQISFFEYVTGITIGNIGAEMVTGLEKSIVNALLGMGIYAAVPYLVGSISLKSKPFRDFVEGHGVVFIENGKILEDNLKKERYTIDELLALLRQKDVFQVSEVEFAVLEPTGDLSVLLKKENQPLIAKDLHLNVMSVKETQTVIMDGNILYEPLAKSGRSRGWLHNELDKLGVTVENVFLGQVSSDGNLMVDLFDDKRQISSPQDKLLLLAAMKKCQADLEYFASTAESKEARERYSENSKKFQEAIYELALMLKR